MYIIDDLKLDDDIVDFSRESGDFKERLWAEISKTIPSKDACELSEDDLDLVNAAGSIELASQKKHSDS